MKDMGIADVAELFHVTHRQLRFWEQAGLLETTRNGPHRVYDGMAVKRIRYIMKWRNMGFQISEVRQLIQARFLGGNETAVFNSLASKRLKALVKEQEDTARKIIAMRTTMRDATIAAMD